MKIPITKPTIDECEKEKVLEVLDSGWLVQGKNVKKFEILFAEFTGAKYAIATTSCTTALHLGLEALEIGKGDKVIVPSFTYIASANAVEYTGAEVVFFDIDLKTFNINENKLEEILEKDKSIKAIMPVNLFGLCANLPKIIEIANKYNVKVIEDSACGFDSWIGNKHSGTFGNVGCFSFHPRKPITTGEGGMLITNDESIAKLAMKQRDHGAEKSDLARHRTGGSLLPDFKVKGYNYRMTDLQGAMGICQMKKSKWIMKERRKVANWYFKALTEFKINGLTLAEYLIPPYIPQNYKHSYQSFVCLFTDGKNIFDLIEKYKEEKRKLKEIVDKINIKRNIFMEKLENLGIATRQGTHAIHTLSYYKNKYKLKEEDYIMSYIADRLSIALPLYAGMKEEEFYYVIENIKKALK